MASQKPRVATKDGPHGREITISAPRDRAVPVRFAIVLLGWLGMAGYVGAATVWGGDPGLVEIFVALLAVWTLLLVFFVVKARWVLFGREVVLVGTERLVVTRMPRGSGPRRDFVSACIHRLRVRPEYEGVLEGSGVIAFDYEGMTHRLGERLDTDEAERVLKAILEKKPEWGRNELGVGSPD